MKYKLAKDDKLSQKLSKLRWQHRPYITQSELAKELLTNQTEISRIENGAYPSVMTLLHYCSFFKISADELLGLEPNNKIEYM